MAKPHCYPAKTVMAAPAPCPPETDECPNHPDLYLLRDAAADGRRSPTTWVCAAETCLDEIFLDVADEMEHYAETMRLFPGLIRSRPKCSQKKLSTCW